MRYYEMRYYEMRYYEMRYYEMRYYEMRYYEMTPGDWSKYKNHLWPLLVGEGNINRASVGILPFIISVRLKT